jgi:hypothetical protein
MATRTQNGTSNVDLFDFGPEMEMKRLVVGVFFLSLFWAIVLPSTVLFLRRRNLHPISRRFPLQVAFIQLYLAVTVTSQNARLVPRY